MADGPLPEGEHVFISPHLDDVALSVGGLVAQKVRQGAKVRVITVCTREPDPENLGALARKLHQRFGEERDPVAARRREDQAAMSCLGAHFEWLEELDAVYRHPAYGSVEALFGPQAAGDGLLARLKEHLFRLLEACPLGHYYLPLGIGGHVDHEVVHEAGMALLDRGATISFYEELPYALAPGAVAQRLRSIGRRLSPCCIDVTRSFPDKLRAALMYRTQIPVLFATEENLFESLIRYALSVSATQSRCCERLWRKAPVSRGA